MSADRARPATPPRPPAQARNGARVAGGSPRPRGAGQDPRRLPGPGRRQLVAHVRLRRGGPVRAGGDHRRAAGDGVRAVRHRRVGIGRVHPGPARARVVRARSPQLRVVGADRGHRRAHAAGAAVRRLPPPARAELDGGARPVRPGGAVRALRLSAPLGPEGILGEAGRGDDRGQRAGRRRHGPGADPGRRRLRQPDADPRLRLSCDGAAGAADGTAHAAHLSVPAPRLQGEVVAGARAGGGARGAGVAGSGTAQRGRRRAGVGRRRRRGDRSPRRPPRIAGRSDLELPGAPGVVRAAAVSAAHVLRGTAGDRRDDDHSRPRDGAGVRAPLPRSREDQPAT